jgi:hypothetical protein
MPAFLRHAFSYFSLTLAAAFTLMLFIPARFFAISVVSATPVITSTADPTTKTVHPRHLRPSHPATHESADRRTAAGAMLALVLVRTQAQRDQAQRDEPSQ